MNKPEHNVFLQTNTGAKITRVETIPLVLPFHVPFKIANGAARPSVEILLVRLHTDQGIVGIGETQAWRRQGSSETLASLTRVIEDHFAPRLVGQSPFALPSILRNLEETIYHSLYAQAAVADALYDLQGKMLGVPVYQLLGGKFRDRIRVYCDTALYQTRLPQPEQFAAAIQRGYEVYGEAARAAGVKPE